MASPVHWRPKARLAGLVLAAGLAVTATSGVIAAPPAGAQGVPSLAAPVITSPSSGAQEPTPTVEVTGTADPGSEVVVADDSYWVGEARSDPSSGSWSAEVDLLAGTSHSLTALEVSGTTVGPSSPAVSVTVSSDELVGNGSFEDPEFTAGAGTDWQSSIPGWSPTTTCAVPDESIELQGTNPGQYHGPGGSVTPYDGSQYVELAPDCVSGVTQTIATVPGAQYTLTFAYQATPGSLPSDNTMAVDWGGTAVAPDLQGGSSWVLATYDVTASSSATTLAFVDTNSDVDCANGQDLNDDINCTVGDLVDDVAAVPTASLAPGNTSWATAQGLTLSDPPGAATASTPGTINFSGEPLWYDFPVLPGEQVSVGLDDVPASYKVALFSDIKQVYDADTASAPNLVALEAEDPGNNASAATFSPFNDQPFNDQPFNDQPVLFSPFNDQPFNDQADAQAAEDDSLLAVSTQAGGTDQSVQANTWNDTGNFFVEVFGDNGAFSTSPFTLTVTTSGTTCASNLSTYADDGYATASGGTISGAGTDYATVVVADSRTMPQVSPTYDAATGSATGGNGSGGLYPALEALARATNGVVLDVGQSNWVNDTTTQADAAANLACPYAVDLEADAIQSIVNTYRAPQAGNLHYVVVVGDDDVIPFFRYADQEAVGPESNYQVPLSSTSAAQAALAKDYYLTDDPYG
ncbi:MAG: hypothetical protein ACRDZX_12700, partial [Acidimicrobiales bacterium]